MLIYFFEYLEGLNIPGAGMFQYISFRSAMAIITSLLISLIYGKRIINLLSKYQIGDEVRKLGLEGENQKTGTPTMGGLIILASILVPTLLFGDLGNVYVVLMIITTVWLGFIGFVDDYIKVFKKDKRGLAGKFKLIGQISLGIIVGLTLYINEDVVIREKVYTKGNERNEIVERNRASISKDYKIVESKSTRTTIPFFKNNEFDYAYLIAFVGEKSKKWAWIIFILAVISRVLSIRRSFRSGIKVNNFSLFPFQIKCTCPIFCTETISV